MKLVSIGNSNNEIPTKLIVFFSDFDILVLVAMMI